MLASSHPRSIDQLTIKSLISICYPRQKNGLSLFCLPIMCVASLVRAARNVTMRALDQRAKAMETLAKNKKGILMKGTPTLLPLAWRRRHG